MITLLEIQRWTEQVESEIKTTVSGREATKFVTIISSQSNDTSNDLYVRRHVGVLVPIDTGVFVVQAMGSNQQMQSIMPQIDTINYSTELK